MIVTKVADEERTLCQAQWAKKISVASRVKRTSRETTRAEFGQKKTRGDRGGIY